MPRSSHTIGLLLDDPATAESLTTALKSMGHTPRKLKEEALGALPDAISMLLIDAESARQHAEQVLASKQAQAPNFLPLLLLLDPGSDSRPWLRRGFDDILRRPPNEGELQARVNVFLRLREQTERRYEALFTHAPIGMYRLDMQERFQMANPALLELLGVDSLGDLQTRSGRVGPVGDRSELHHRLRQDRRILGLESEWRARDGSLIPVRENATAVHDRNGEVLYYEGTVEDMSERRQAAEALREAKERAELANRSTSAFLTNMSHEIRTPLTGIIGFASLLSEKLDERESRFARRIETSGRRLLDTLNAVLTIAQLEAGRAELHVESLDTEQVVRKAAAPFIERAEEKGLAFEVQLPTESLRVSADRSALSSIVQNLVGNAVKFTRHGTVSISIESGPLPSRCTLQERSSHFEAGRPLVHITVQDTGPGMPHAKLPRLLDSFVQGDTGTTRSFEGSGLGLSITSRLLELLGGVLTIHSSPHEGTTVTASLPVPGDQAATLAAAPTTRTGDPRILIVEDNPDTLFLLTEVLKPLGSVTQARGMAEGQEKARRMPHDLVVMDIHLGESRGGVELMHELKARDAYDEVPFIAITAYALPGDRERFIREGFIRHIEKPFAPDHLINVVQECLEKHAPRRSAEATS